MFITLVSLSDQPDKNPRIIYYQVLMSIRNIEQPSNLDISEHLLSVRINDDINK